MVAARMGIHMDMYMKSRMDTLMVIHMAIRTITN